MNDTSFYSFQELRSWQFQQDDINEEGIKEYSKFEISFSDQMKLHETKKPRLLSILSDIGGLINFVFIAFCLIFKPLAKYAFTFETIQSLYEIRTKDFTLQEQSDQTEDAK